MLRYFMYPVFGLTVLSGYALSAASPGSIRSSVPVERHVLSAGSGAAAGAGLRGPLGAAAAATALRAGRTPVWRTRFHGPAVYRPPSSSGSRYGGSSYYGGSGFGK